MTALLPSDSPRLSGTNEEHVRLLRESVTPLPPIIVHSPSMRVIDGMHRLHVAMSRGDRVIGVRYFTGDEQDAFVLAVRANAAHGLPLTAAERSAAAERIIGSHPQWSDRAIAAIVGLAPRTVATIRGRAGADREQPDGRVGRDGRRRPVDPAAGRRRAAELILADPSASIRSVARIAGVSPSTVSNVRKRLDDGVDPVPTGQALAGNRGSDLGRRVAQADSTLRQLRNDPSLRHKESGRELLRWLEFQAAGARAHERLADMLPSHCAATVVQLARRNAEMWREFADQLDRRRQDTAE